MCVLTTIYNRRRGRSDNTPRRGGGAVNICRQIDGYCRLRRKYYIILHILCARCIYTHQSIFTSNANQKIRRRLMDEQRRRQQPVSARAGVTERRRTAGPRAQRDDENDDDLYTGARRDEHSYPVSNRSTFQGAPRPQLRIWCSPLARVCDMYTYYNVRVNVCLRISVPVCTNDGNIIVTISNAWVIHH